MYPAQNICYTAKGQTFYNLVFEFVMPIAATPTYGEKLLNKFLRDLPRKQFFYHHEPQINTLDGHSSKPDFVVVAALLGVVVIEVKDWVKLTGGDQQLIHTV